MKQNEFSVNLSVYEDGTLAVHGGDIRGLIIEANGIEEMREELLRIAPRLLRSNHGLTDEEVGQASIRLVLRAPHDASTQARPKSQTALHPRLLWEDDPRITACD